MDPAPETLRHVTSSPPAGGASPWAPRARLTAASAAVVAIVMTLVLAAQGGPAAVRDGLALASALAMYVVFRQLPFEIGRSVTTAAQTALVPLWFLLPPAALPLVVVGAELVARVVAAHRAGRRLDAASAVVAWGAGFRVLGPAVVFAALQPGAASWADAPVYALAFAAQLTTDGLWRLASSRARAGGGVDASGGHAASPHASGGHASSPQASVGHAASPRGSGVVGVGELRARWALDAALTPVALLGAVAMVDAPWMLWTVAPIAVLLGHFSKERDQRLVRAQELSRAYRGTAQLMGDVLEADDAYTGGEHTEGVVELSLAVGTRLALNAERMRNLEFGALLHDIGKLRVPNEIINKPGKLNDEEWAIIKEHPRYGQEMLDRVGGALSDAGPIVRAHHERWDGAGYPDGLAGEAIPIEARIITACDSFSAMTTNRSYRRAMSDVEAVAELERCSGSQFDPDVVVALRAVVAEHPQSRVPSSVPLTAVPDPAPVHPATAPRAAGDAAPGRAKAA